MLTPNATNSVIHPNGKLAFVVDDDPDFGSDGFRVAVIMWRDSTMLPWANSSNVWGSRWPEPTPRPFPEFATYVMNIAAVRLHALNGAGTPPLNMPPGPYPTDWPDVKAWLLGNSTFVDAPPGIGLAFGHPTPPAVAFAANEVFNIGKQRIAAHLEVAEDGSSTMSFQRWTPPDNWLPVKVE